MNWKVHHTDSASNMSMLFSNLVPYPESFFRVRLRVLVFPERHLFTGNQTKFCSIIFRQSEAGAEELFRAAVVVLHLKNCLLTKLLSFIHWLQGYRHPTFRWRTCKQSCGMFFSNITYSESA